MCYVCQHDQKDYNVSPCAVFASVIRKTNISPCVCQHDQKDCNVSPCVDRVYLLYGRFPRGRGGHYRPVRVHTCSPAEDWLAGGGRGQLLWVCPPLPPPSPPIFQRACNRVYACAHMFLCVCVCVCVINLTVKRPALPLTLCGRRAL